MYNYYWLAVLVVSFLVCNVVANKGSETEALSCKDENGDAVDWWAESKSFFRFGFISYCFVWYISISLYFRYYLYKLPGRFGTKHKTKGQLYTYFTSKSSSFVWVQSEKLVGDLDSVVGRTVSQAYVDNSKVNFLLEEIFARIFVYFIKKEKVFFLYKIK